MEQEISSDFKNRIEKLKNSESVISNGMEYDGLYELNNRSAEKYIRNCLRGNYLNTDTGELIRITRKGAEKVTRHDAENIAHLKSIALIPQLIMHSVYITEEENEKDKNALLCCGVTDGERRLYGKIGDWRQKRQYIL